jgi:beta-glucosidase-like glycosyl hydrolase
VRKIGVATALEVRATGIHWTFAPCIAVSIIQNRPDTSPLRGGSLMCV